MKANRLWVIIILSIFEFNYVDGQIVTIHKTAFEINFDTIRKVPIYNYYEFTSKNRVNNGAQRSASFHPEVLINKRLQARDCDYGRPYDKGHYVPNDDMRYNEIVQYENMSYANVAPQWSSMNEVQWRLIENYVRGLGMKYDTLKIYTGGIFLNTAKSIGPDNICIPEFYFKTIMVYDKGKIIAGLGFLCKNCPLESHDPAAYVVTIDYIETLLGIDLYPSLKDQSFEAENILIK